MERNILFLCTGNSARSQMGEALLKKHAKDYFNVYSAGIEPAEQIFPQVIEAMKEIGIDISDRKRKGVEPCLGKKNFEKVIIVCSDAEKKCPRIFGFSQRVFWPFEDPSSAAGSEETLLEVCRKVRGEIDRKICEWIDDQGIAARPVSPPGEK